MHVYEGITFMDCVFLKHATRITMFLILFLSLGLGKRGTGSWILAIKSYSQRILPWSL